MKIFLLPVPLQLPHNVLNANHITLLHFIHIYSISYNNPIYSRKNQQRWLIEYLTLLSVYSQDQYLLEVFKTTKKSTPPN